MSWRSWDNPFSPTTGGLFSHTRERDPACHSMSHQESLILKPGGVTRPAIYGAVRSQPKDICITPPWNAMGTHLYCHFSEESKSSTSQDFVRPRLCSCLRTVAENQGFLPRAKGKTSATQSLRHQKWGKIYCTYSKQMVFLAWQHGYWIWLNHMNWMGCQGHHKRIMTRPGCKT